MHLALPRCHTATVETLAPDGTVIGWDEAGSGPALLLVHGATATGAAWNPVRALLPGGIRVAAMDRRGRGQSGGGAALDYSLEVEADDILAVAAALGGGVVVAAHSVGATITLRALLRSGDLIKAAVLYEPPILKIPPADAMHTALAAGQPEQARIAFLRSVVEMSGDDIEAFRAAPTWARSVELMWTVDREHSALRALDSDLSQYRGVHQPIRLLVGSHGSPHQVEGVAALAAVLPHAETTVLEGQGHGALVQGPALVASAIAEVLQETNRVA